MDRPKICLNMIVKNEASVILRLLNSVKDVITSYVIVDTGSTDNTKDIIKTFMSNNNIPGDIFDHSWVNFSHNRNQALNYAITQNMADWVLLIDADEELVWPDLSTLATLKVGKSYSLEKHHSSIRYALPNLIDISTTKWEWEGVVHEYLKCLSSNIEVIPLKNSWIIYHSGEGCRSRGKTQKEKFLEDADLLEQALQSNPEDTRSLFYLAQSYRDAGCLDKAHVIYTTRSKLNGWDEETFVAKYNAGKLLIIQHNLKQLQDDAPIINSLLDAYSFRPSRGAEPLHALAEYFRGKRDFVKAYLFAKMGSDIPFPTTDRLFVEHEIYTWKILDELSIAAYWTGKYEESAELCENLLPIVPEEHYDRILSNLNFALTALGKPQVANTRKTFSLEELLNISRLVDIVDIGANPIDGIPPYKPLLEANLCNVVGFEPQEAALATLLKTKSDNETYLPYIIADGLDTTLNVCQASGMTSILRPDPHALQLFLGMEQHGTVIETSKVKTVRLDDVTGITNIDFLKMDIQGAELLVLENGRDKLATAVAIQLEVSFFPLYENQPTFGELDCYLRSIGFIPHNFVDIKRWGVGGEGLTPSQLLEADILYIRCKGNSVDKVKQLILILHYCYKAYDTVCYYLKKLQEVKNIPSNSVERYLQHLKTSCLDK